MPFTFHVASFIVLVFLVLRASGRARKRNGIAHVHQASDVGHRAFEAEPKAGVGNGAVTAQVPVPLVAFLARLQLFHPCVEYFQALLALAAADDLADAWREDV